MYPQTLKAIFIWVSELVFYFEGKRRILNMNHKTIDNFRNIRSDQNSNHKKALIKKFKEKKKGEKSTFIKAVEIWNKKI